jgi:hypothetical protein
MITDSKASNLLKNGSKIVPTGSIKILSKLLGDEEFEPSCYRIKNI